MCINFLAASLTVNVEGLMVSEWCCRHSSWCKWLHWHTVFIHKYWMNWILSVNAIIFVKKVIWWLLMNLNGVKNHRTLVGVPSWGSAVLLPPPLPDSCSVRPVGKTGLSPTAWKCYFLHVQCVTGAGRVLHQYEWTALIAVNASSECIR